MTSAVDITGSVSSLNVAPAPQVQAATTATSAPATKAAAPAGQNNTAISPKISYDPTAGVIIQFLSDTGEVQSQIPSQTVVAYLRAGLTPQGLNKPKNTEA